MAKEFPVGTIRDWESGTVIKAHDPIKPFSNGWILLKTNQDLNNVGIQCDNIAREILAFKEPIDGMLFLDHEIKEFEGENGEKFDPDDFKQYSGFFGAGRYSFRNEFSKRFMNDRMRLSEQINSALAQANDSAGGDAYTDKLSPERKEEIRKEVRDSFKESEIQFDVKTAEKLKDILIKTLGKLKEGTDFKDPHLKEVYEGFKKIADNLPATYQNIKDKRSLKDSTLEVINKEFSDNWGITESSKQYIEKKFNEFVRKYADQISKDNLKEQIDLFGVDMNMDQKEFYTKIFNRLKTLTEQQIKDNSPAFKDLVYLRFIKKYNKVVEGNWTFDLIPAIYDIEVLLNKLPKEQFLENESIQKIVSNELSTKKGYAYFSSSDSSVNFSPNCVTDRSFYFNDTDVQEDKNEFRSTVLHEIGHGYSKQLGRNENYDYKKFVVESGWTYQSPDLRYNRHATGDDKPIQRTGSNSHISLLTDYSNVSPEEAFAEYYSFYNTNKAGFDQFFNTGDKKYLEKYVKVVADSVPSERAIGELLFHKVLSDDDENYKKFNELKLSDRGSEIELTLISPWEVTLSKEERKKYEPQNVRTNKDKSIHSMPPVILVKDGPSRIVIDGGVRIESAKLNKKLAPSLEISKEMYDKSKEIGLTDEELVKCLITKNAHKYTSKQIAPSVKLKGLYFGDKFISSSKILENFGPLSVMKKICEPIKK